MSPGPYLFVPHGPFKPLYVIIGKFSLHRTACRFFNLDGTLTKVRYGVPLHIPAKIASSFGNFYPLVACIDARESSYKPSMGCKHNTRSNELHDILQRRDSLICDNSSNQRIVFDD